MKPIQLTGTTWEYIVARDANDDILWMQGTTVPTATTTGYAKGALFVDTDVATGTSGLYQNIGTNTSCNFQKISSADAGSFTNLTATGNTILGDAVTDTLTITGATSIESTSANALAVGANGATNPVLNLDASTASVATWLNVAGAAAAWGVAVSALSSGTNESLTLDAKGTGTITLNGTATGNIILGADTTGAVGITSTSATAWVGYATGAGWAVTQATNRSTWVTLSKVAGQITTDTTSLAAWAAATFTVTNTTVAATDVVVCSIASAATTNQTNVRVTAVAAGSFDITVENNHASTAETGAIVINFAVIKAVAA